MCIANTLLGVGGVYGEDALIGNNKDQILPHSLDGWRIILQGFARKKL